MKKEIKAELVNISSIDRRTKMLTVLLFETTRGWFRSKTSTTERTYTYVDGLWLDERFRSVTDTGLTWRLQEMLVTNIAEKRLDRFIATL